MNLDPVRSYPYRFIIDGESYISLWQSSDNGPDVFKKASENSILITFSIDELKRILKGQENVYWEEEASIDFDDFWCFIENYKTQDLISTDKCRLVIDVWNFLGDLNLTFDHDKSNTALGVRKLDGIYEKFYYGINLERVSSETRIYNPKISKKEHLEFLNAMKATWDQLSMCTYNWCKSINQWGQTRSIFDPQHS